MGFFPFSCRAGGGAGSAGGGGDLRSPLAGCVFDFGFLPPLSPSSAPAAARAHTHAYTHATAASQARATRAFPPLSFSRLPDAYATRSPHPAAERLPFLALEPPVVSFLQAGRGTPPPPPRFAFRFPLSVPPVAPASRLRRCRCLRSGRGQAAMVAASPTACSPPRPCSFSPAPDSLPFPPRRPFALAASRMATIAK